MNRHRRFSRLVIVLLALVLPATLGAAGTVLAQASPLHPTFPLLDQNGVNVLESGQPVSTMQTCGGCHDTEFIAGHSFHATVGMDRFGAGANDARPWQLSPGLFGRWDPILYRYLTPAGDAVLDLGTPDWIMTYGLRHVGGGPAERTPDGVPLTELNASSGDPAVTSHDFVTGQDTAWDWQQSGVVEMNCFLCHLTEPDNESRIEALEAGQFGWANTATLGHTGLVEKEGEGWGWNPSAFQADGELAPAFVTLQSPTAENCGQCHGTVHQGDTPLLYTDILPQDWHTLRTGQIFSGQRLKESGLNLANKDNLARSWDVHAERGLECSECHFSLNNPIYREEARSQRPDYLTYDPRRLDIGDYLLRPDHNFAKGETAQHLAGADLANSMRRCDSCHDAANTHAWLPYSETHMNALSCEACHIPKLNAPAVEQVDWTVITPSGEGRVLYRGVEGEFGDPKALITGYQPALMPRNEVDGQAKLTPVNLISAWYWVQGDPERPVRQEDLQAAFLDGDRYRPEIMAAFDANEDGWLDDEELRIDNNDKIAAVSSRLLALGLSDPRIKAEVIPANISHDVANGDWATRECKACHSDDSRVTQPLALAAYTPGDVPPQFPDNPALRQAGTIVEGKDGALFFQPAFGSENLYLPGHNRIGWVDIIGWLAVLGVLLGIIAHGGYRLYVSAKNPPQQHELKEVYMYTFYERLWHWTQAIGILLLVATGIIIHRPDQFGWADFGLVVPGHNILAILLVVNAVFAVFYHFASGQIKQYLPAPHGFFNRGITQIDFYLRGIFKGEEHPFEKTPEHKLNPLQQVTYLAILNILLPLQIITGLFMFTVRWQPQLATYLPFMAPVHTLTAWLFVAFIILHIYLTTTGPTITADLEGMITGWDKVEVHGQEA